MERKTSSLCLEFTCGLQPQLIDRISPVPFPRIKSAEWIDITWEKKMNFLGGRISLKVADHINDAGYDIQGNPNMVVSDLETNHDHDYDLHQIRNPRESLSCILTLIATLNQCAINGKGHLLHVVRANVQSDSYFKRFVMAGLYYYCDQMGNRISLPMTVGDGDWTLYACQYPAPGLQNILRQFVVKDASKELMRRYFPSFLTYLFHRY